MLGAEIKQLGHLDQIYEKLENLQPESGHYLKLVIEVIEPYETEGYITNPESLNHALPHLEGDTNELISYLLDINNEERRAVLTTLKSELTTNRPLIAYALRGVFDYFGITGTTGDGSNITRRFRMPNILFSNRTEMERFYLACGLRKGEGAGESGGHQKWYDERGQFVAVSSDTNVGWAKNNIKSLLDNGVPIEKIKEACDKRNIQFTIL